MILVMIINFYVTNPIGQFLVMAGLSLFFPLTGGNDNAFGARSLWPTLCAQANEWPETLGREHCQCSLCVCVAVKNTEPRHAFPCNLRFSAKNMTVSFRDINLSLHLFTLLP